ncbi:MAG: homoserine dehydrogenase [Anaerolineales bacterium]|nr:homoserine dehydrogenase [Anaerolineales bacterium]
MDTHGFALLGFGNVGQAFARLLLAKRDELLTEHDIRWQIIGIMTGHHGTAVNPNGIDLESALAIIAAGDSLDPLSTEPIPQNGVEFVQTCNADVLFENTPVSYDDGQPAIEHISTALSAGMHAITANKGPVVHAYRELTKLANAHGRKFLFESAVMDGAPVFSLWREALPAAELQSFRGVLNSTTNLILTLMEQGKTFEEAVAYTQSIGIAETDPTGDIEGWDAAIKVSALVTVLMGISLKPSDVERKGIESIQSEDIESAYAEGKRWKLICQAERTETGITTSVRPELLDPSDSLYSVMGTSSAVTFHSDVLGPLTITESDPGPHTTAYGLLADFINAVR